MRTSYVSSAIVWVTLVACADAAAVLSPRTPDAVVANVAAIADYTAEDLGDGLVADINAAGDIAGIIFTATGRQPAIWIGSTRTDLGLPAGFSDAAARAINDAGTVVGDASIPDNRGFIWRAGAFTILSAPGAQWTYARDVNNAELVVGGFADPTTGRAHAYRYTGGRFIDLHPRGAQYLESGARALAENGLVAGDVYLSNGEMHAAIWDSKNRFRDLGVLPGGSRVSVQGVNSLGTIVGWADLGGSAFTVPFVWTPQAGMRWTTRPDGALDVSDRGRIAGTRISTVSTAATIMGGNSALLPVPPGATSTSAAAVNQCGSIAGGADVGGAFHVVRWTIAACD